MLFSVAFSVLQNFVFPDNVGAAGVFTIETFIPNLGLSQVLTVCEA